MASLDQESTGIPGTEHGSNRVFPVTVKLTQDEHQRITEHANGLGQARSELMRDLILRELDQSPSSPLARPELVEIVGLRLMLTNLLKPLCQAQKITQERFDAIMTEVRRSKSEIATELLTKTEGGR